MVYMIISTLFWGCLISLIVSGAALLYGMDYSYKFKNSVFSDIFGYLVLFSFVGTLVVGLIWLIRSAVS